MGFMPSMRFINDAGGDFRLPPGGVSIEQDQAIRSDASGKAGFTGAVILTGGVLSTYIGAEAVGLVFVAGSGGDITDVAMARLPAANSTAGSIRNVNKLGGKQNCANCSIATDATIAGNPASALNGGITTVADLEKHFGNTFGTLTSASRIQAQMLKAGDGSRGIIFGSRGSQTGHFFNVVNQNGTVRFLDGQTGGAANLDGFKSFSLMKTN